MSHSGVGVTKGTDSRNEDNQACGSCPTGDLTLTDMYSVLGTRPCVIEHGLNTLKRSYSRLDIGLIILNKVIVAQRVCSLLKDTQPLTAALSQQG